MINILIHSRNQCKCIQWSQFLFQLSILITKNSNQEYLIKAFSSPPPPPQIVQTLQSASVRRDAKSTGSCCMGPRNFQKLNAMYIFFLTNKTKFIVHALFLRTQPFAYMKQNIGNNQSLLPNSSIFVCWCSFNNRLNKKRFVPIIFFITSYNAEAQTSSCVSS